jgi:hypothetical protein
MFSFFPLSFPFFSFPPHFFHPEASYGRGRLRLPILPLSPPLSLSLSISMSRRRRLAAATALGRAASSGAGSSDGRASRDVDVVGKQRRGGYSGIGRVGSGWRRWHAASPQCTVGVVAQGDRGGRWPWRLEDGCRGRAALGRVAVVGSGRGGTERGCRGRQWPWQTRGLATRPIPTAAKVRSHLELPFHLRDFLLH